METHDEGSRGSKGAAFSTVHREHFERRLLEERRRAVAQMAEFDDQMGQSQDEATGELTSWRFHMADVGTETYEREQSFLMASREGRLLWLIDSALRRLYASPDSFGRCEQCGATIAYERLDAIPYVAHCVDCKQDWEGGQAD
jgi:DnaK suppressor protein